MRIFMWTKVRASGLTSLAVLPYPYDGRVELL